MLQIAGRGRTQCSTDILNWYFPNVTHFAQPPTASGARSRSVQLHDCFRGRAPTSWSTESTGANSFDCTLKSVLTNSQPGTRHFVFALRPEVNGTWVWLRRADGQVSGWVGKEHGCISWNGQKKLSRTSRDSWTGDFIEVPFLHFLPPRRRPQLLLRRRFAGISRGDFWELWRAGPGTARRRALGVVAFDVSVNTSGICWEISKRTIHLLFLRLMAAEGR